MIRVVGWSAGVDYFAFFRLPNSVGGATVRVTCNLNAVLQYTDIDPSHPTPTGVSVFLEYFRSPGIVESTRIRLFD